MVRRMLLAAVALALFGSAPILAQFDAPPKPPQAIKPPAIDPARPVPGDFQPPDVPFPPGGGFPTGFQQTNYKDLIPPLIELMNDTDKETRESACMALSRVGRQAVKPLLDILKDKDKDVDLRANAAYVLGKMGPAAQEAVPDLTKALRDSSRDIRRRAAFALSHIIQDENHGFPFGGGFPAPGGVGGGIIGGPGFPGGGVPPPPVKPVDPGVIGPKPGDKPPIEKPPVEKPPVEKPDKPIEK